MKINSTIIKTFLLIIISAGITFNASAKNKKPKGKNIALCITKKKTDKQKVNHFNLGLMSYYKELQGASINILSDISTYKSKGAQISGLINITGYNNYGAQISGLANVTGYKAYGLRLGGLMNISGNSTTGFQISGLGNVAGKSQKGVSIAGLINLSSKDNTGVSISGLANISGENLTGFAISGLMNVNGSDMKGVQLSSLLNIVGKENRGLQLSALGNVSVINKGVQLGVISNYSVENRGLQVGLTNISSNPKAKSVQLGILNICKDSTNISRQIGLINIKPHTRTQLLISSGNINKANIAVRLKNNLIYTQWEAGMLVGKITDKASLSATYRTGLSIPLIKEKLNLNTDIGYSHIETLKNKNIPDRLYSIQPRMGIEYSFNKNFGIFATGGYSWTRTYKGNRSFSKDPVIEIGIVLF